MNLKLIALSTAGVIGLFGFFSSYYTIDEGEEGVVLRYGKVVRLAGSGLHFKMPFMESVEKISIRTQTVALEKVAMYSKDQQPAEAKISITFSILEGHSDKLYANLGDIENAFVRIIQPIVLQEFKNVFGKFTATSAIQDRTRLTTDTMMSVNQALKNYPYLKVTGVQIENIDFSDVYEKTIEERMKAEVEVQRSQQELSKEKVQSEIKITKAKADAEAELMKAKAEAEALDIKGDAIARNPSIVELTKAEKWDGKLPQITGNVTPFMNIKQ